MGLFSRIKNNVEERKGIQRLEQTFKLLSGYSAVFTSFNGGLYEMGLTRSCIDKIATQCSKLHPCINGNKNYNNNVTTPHGNKLKEFYFPIGDTESTNSEASFRFLLTPKTTTSVYFVLNYHNSNPANNKKARTVCLFGDCKGLAYWDDGFKVLNGPPNVHLFFPLGSYNSNSNLGIGKKVLKGTQNLKALFKIAIPTTGSRLIGSIGYFLEPIILTYVLLKVGYSSNYITTHYGIINGYVYPLLLLPSFFTLAISNACLKYSTTCSS